MRKIRDKKWNRRFCKWMVSLLMAALLANQSSILVLAEENGADAVIVTDEEMENPGAGEETEDVDAGEGENTGADADTVPDTGADEETEDSDAGEGEDADADIDDVSDVDAEDEEIPPFQEDEAENVVEEDVVSPAAVGSFFSDSVLWYTIINEKDLQVEVMKPPAYVTPASGEVVIPPTVLHGGDEYEVVSIGEWAFQDCSSLTGIIIPDSVTSIAKGAFDKCSSLISVTIPNGVANIENYTFYECSSLENITIPDSVTSIGENVFYGCSSLGSITVPDKVTSIGNWAFGSCSSLASITIPDSVSSIGKHAFYGCSSLESSITIPYGVTSIEFGTFWGCTKLTSVTIPDSVTSIDVQAFRECSSLKNITIPDSVTSIGQAAFCLCSSLTSITIPNSVTSIEMQVFSGCEELASVIIPRDVTSIKIFAFANCKKLENVTILNDNIDINAEAFLGCEGLSSLGIALTENITITPPQNISNDHFKDCPDDRSLTFLTEDGTAVLSNETALAAAVKTYDEADHINDGKWYGWNLPDAPDSPDVPDYLVTVHVNKDGSTWSDCAKEFTLSSDNGATFTDLTNASDGTYTINIPNGKYTIYEKTEEVDGLRYVDTGFTVNVEKSAIDVEVNYWTVTFYDGDKKISEQIVPENAKVNAPSPAPIKDGYTLSWVTHNPDGSSEEFHFDKSITNKTDIYASWTLNKEEEDDFFTITASAGTGGSVSPSGEAKVKSGDNQRFTITPEEDYRISSVLVDGNEVLESVQAVDYAKSGITDAQNNAKYYDFENVTGNHTLAAFFEAIQGGDDSGSGGTGDGDDGGSGDDAGDGDDSGSGGTGGGNSGSGGSSGGDTDSKSSIDGFGNTISVISSDMSVASDAGIVKTGSTAPASQGREPKTGDTSHMEIYATIAMIAGLSYILLYFADGKSGMTEEEKKEIVAALVNWAKKGSRLKKYAALAVIFMVLVYYHSIGKRTSADWKEIYAK